MPQFDLANANISSAGVTKIKNRIGFVPFVYDTGYPNLGKYVDNDPVPSGSTIYAESVGGRVPYDPDFHNGVRGNLVVGYGHTYRNEGGQWRGSDALFYNFYTVKENSGDSNATPFTINGVDYVFPIQKGDIFATTDDGGNYLDSNSTVITKGIRIKYIGDDSSVSNQRFSESIASTLLNEDLVGYKNKVISVFTGSEDAFPYDNTLAQQHFDMMVGLCFAIGKSAFENTLFVHQYKQVTGSSVTSSSDLTAYNDAGYSLMFLGGKAKPSDYPNGDASSASNLIMEHYEPIVINGVKVTWENLFLWDPSLIKQRQEDIDELLGSDSTVNPTATPLNPITNSQWYQGPPITQDFFMARPNAPAWKDVVTSTLPTGSVSNTILTLLANGQEDQIPLYYTGDASVYDTDPGNENYWEESPYYQKAFSTFWQLNNRWYKGAQTYIAIRPETTNGPAIAAQADGSVPPYIFGLDNGSGELQVFMTSTRAESNIDGITGIDTTIWDIANGVKLGDVANGQWVHRAITRKGNKFTTWENGTKVTEWSSDKTVKRVTRDAKTGGTDEKASMKLSIGRSQQADYFKGYIDGLKITKGEALYLANFTPSSSAPTIDTTSNSYTGLHNVESVLNALKKIMSQMDTEYRVNNTGTLDAGPRENLFEGHGTNDPKAIIVRDSSGEDPGIIGLNPDALTTQFEAEDWVSGVEYLKNVGSDGQNIDLVERFLTNVPYYDLFGNKLERVAYVNEQDTNELMAPKRAEAYLDEFTRTKKSLSLSLEYYDIKGDFEVGDNIFVYDPEVGFVDDLTKAIADGRTEPYEAIWQGQYINPEKIRIIGITYPIEDSFGVYLRKVVSTNPYTVRYIDLSDYVVFESGNTQLDVGDLGQQIGDDLRFSEFSLSKSTAGAFSIPNLPSTPTLQSGTYLDATGNSSGFIRVTVSRPTNIDGSQITDGSHYKVRYKRITESDYSYQNFPFTGASSESLLIQDLTVGETYDVGVAVVDKSGFKKMSAYDGTGEDLYTNSSSVNANYATNARVEIEKDGQAPSKPKTATIAAGPLRVQVTHYLGKDGTDGNGNPYGNFTLEGDVDHLDVHAVTQSGNSASFTTSASTKIGEVRVTSGNLLQQIPVISTIELEDSEDYYFRIIAVDKSGNSSDASDGQSATANLIAEANIADATITTAKIGDAQITTAKIGDAQITSAKVNDLSADKLTSGTITGGEITVGGVSNTDGFIQSYNFSTGSAGWQIAADGSAEFQNATIRGSLNASDMQTGTLDASNVTITNLNATSITAGTIDADRIPTITTSKINFDAGDIGGAEAASIIATINNSGESNITIDADKLNLTGVLAVDEAIDVGGSDASSFHVDVDGNMWLGAGTYASAPFRVSSAGALAASSFSLTGGSMTNPNITIQNTSSGTPSGGSGKRIDIGNSFLFDLGNAGLTVSSNALRSNRFEAIYDGTATDPSISIIGDHDELGFYVTNNNDFNYSIMHATNGSNDVFHWNGLSTNVTFHGSVTIEGSSLSVNGDSGSSSQYLGKDSGGTLGYHDLPASQGNYSNNTSGVSINNSNSQINFSFGNTNNTFSRGHNHPYGTSNLNNNNVNGDHHNHNGLHNSHDYFTNSDVVGSGHNHSGYVPTSHQLNSNNPHGINNKASVNSVNTLSSSFYAHLDLYHGGSDERLKDNITDTTFGLDYINSLRPVDFQFTQAIADEFFGEDDSFLKTEYLKPKHGFIAQEVQTATFENHSSNNAFGGLGIRESKEGDSLENVLNLDMNQFIGPLVKAVQQLSAKIDVLEARVDELEGA